MNTTNPLRDLFRGIVHGAPDKAPVVANAATLDSAGKDDDAEEVMDAVASHVETDIRLKSAAAVQQWAETDDLDEGEGSADRLLAMLIGIADADMDGEISEEESELVGIAAEASWDYLAAKGVSEEDLNALLNDWDNEVGSKVQELVASKLPDGEEASAMEIDEFAFGDGGDEAALDATYRKKMVVRKGKKVRINKRISGTVRLSAKQKMAVRKMLRKSHSARATMRRAKSNRVRKQTGL